YHAQVASCLRTHAAAVLIMIMRCGCGVRQRLSTLKHGHGVQARDVVCVVSTPQTLGSLVMKTIGASRHQHWLRFRSAIALLGVFPALLNLSINAILQMRYPVPGAF